MCIRDSCWRHHIPWLGCQGWKENRIHIMRLNRKTHHNLIIIGGGITGMLAASYFRSLSPVIFDSGPKHSGVFANHKAVMRLRDPEIGTLLGIRMQEVVVSKSVWFCGESHKEASIAMRNMYSMKVNGNLSNRSIHD